MINVLERPNIKLTSIEIDYDKSVQNDGVDFNVEQLGKYPYVYLEGAIIEAKDIKNLKITNDSMYPQLEMEFADPTGKLVDEKHPLDGSLISIFINSNDDTFMPIRMDFIILDYYIIKGGDNSDSLSYRIIASLNIEDLYIIKSESYKGSSFDVLKTICKDMGIGFASNIKSTDDVMIWINGSNYRYDFVEDIIQHSYVSDEAFLFGYVDFYYNFNYVDIETALQEDISKQDTIASKSKILKDGEKNIVPLILTNNPDRDNPSLSHLFISKYTVDNKTTRVNFDNGYTQIDAQYNKSDDKYDDFALDTISDSGSDGRIIMKGKKDDSFLYDNLIKSTWTGKMDNENCHNNYLYSEIQNKTNLEFLQKIKMVIKLKTPNYSLYRFQKVLVELYNMGKTETEEESTGSVAVKDVGDNQYDNKIVNKLSGEWLITAINFTFNRTEGNVQEITLVKRELTSKYVFKK